MNAAAYSTQIFLDQREQLLRATAASAGRNLAQLPASETPSRMGASRQIRLFPLLDGPDRYQWSLVLMPRAVEAFAQAQVELIYTSMVSGATQVVLGDELPSSFTLSAQTQRWIRDMLAAQADRLRPGEPTPVVWLTPPGTQVKKLFMYLPLDAADPQAGWLGIAIPDIASKLDLSHLKGSSYALYAPEGRPIVRGEGAPQSVYLEPSEEDGFALDPGHSYFENFVLSKSVGDAGWRLRYFMPRDQLLKDVLPRWSWAFVLFLLALVGICSGCRQIHRRMLQPASAHVSNALLATVNNTLDLARIEAGHQPLAHAPFSPLQLVEEVVFSFAMRAESKGLKLYFTVDATTPALVLGDVKLLRQVLDNFVNNAIKFTESGSVLLRLHSALAAEKQVHLQFQVIDTGIGMAQESVQRVFEPYFRVEGDNAFRGTGLGLSICARLAQALQAKLDAKSQLGVGTCMELALTLPVPAHAEPENWPQLLAGPVHVRGADPEVVASTCGWLRRWGAKALPYRTDLAEEDGAVLVEAWPCMTPLAHWSGPQVLAHALTQVVDQAPSCKAQTWRASAYSLLELGQAVQQAQGAGSAPAKQVSPGTMPVNVRVLVAEDHPVTRMILIEQLQQLGCEVASVPNGKEALQLQGIMEFDLIFTDWNMPILNGFELTQALGGFKTQVQHP